MLIRFRTSNFRSLRDETELSLVASPFEDESGSLVPREEIGLSLLRVAGIYGANAAGKSNVLAAMGFMSSAVRRASHRSWNPEGPIPRQPFLLEPEEAREPSLFEADFLLEGVRYRYGFLLDSQRILREWLHAYPNRRGQLWFAREADAQPVFTFGKHLKGNHRAIESLTRKNSLFLSVAAENNHPTLAPVYSWLAEKFAATGMGDRASSQELAFSLLKYEHYRPQLLEILKRADLGISGWSLLEQRETANLWSDNFLEETRPYRIYLKHDSGSDPAGIAIPFREESRGTQAWFGLASLILVALENGSVLTVDELDASLHPHLALEVLRIFQDPQQNPKNAQLIFNTHDTNLLGTHLGPPALRRDQIWLVEKDREGATHLYPLTDFKPRKGENLERGYLQGRYGAIPFLGEMPFSSDAPV